MNRNTVRATGFVIPVIFVSVFSLNCGGSESNGDLAAADVQDSGTDYERVLNAGPGQNANRLPDCDHYKEWTNLTSEPVEGENCIVWGLPAWGGLMGQAASVIALVDIDDSIVDYYDGHIVEYACETWTGFAQERATIDYSFVPVDFKVVDIWKNLHGEVAGGIIQGYCKMDEAPLCRFGGGRWNLQPGLNLVLMGQLCCADKYSEGYFDIQAVYPVENGYVYDWDGDVIAVDAVRGILSSFPQEQAEAVGNLDSPCVQPDTRDVIEPTDADVLEVVE